MEPVWAKRYRDNQERRSALNPNAGDDEDDDNASPPGPNTFTQKEASEALYDYLVMLKFGSKLNAKEVGIIAFWAQRAGVEGATCALSQHPWCQNFSR